MIGTIFSFIAHVAMWGSIPMVLVGLPVLIAHDNGSHTPSE